MVSEEHLDVKCQDLSPESINILTETIELINENNVCDSVTTEKANNKHRLTKIGKQLENALNQKIAYTDERF